MRTLGSERHIGRFTEILLEKRLKQFVKYCKEPYPRSEQVGRKRPCVWAVDAVVSRLYSKYVVRYSTFALVGEVRVSKSGANIPF